MRTELKAEVNEIEFENGFAVEKRNNGCYGLRMREECVRK